MSFEILNSLNVNDKTEKKKDLTYLSWAWAWTEFKKVYPEAKYNIKRFNSGDGIERPYMYDDLMGYMVMTEVTVDELTYEMWLPVMDNNNKAMKKEEYSYKTKYGGGTVQAATMFDINKSLMRCLTKNLAMFGLGLYIYAGEDLPDDGKVVELIDKSQQQQIIDLGKSDKAKALAVLKKYGYKASAEIETKDFENILKELKG